uniref:Hemicentin 2 n=1 Tax=Pelodiscus sinensis TaxID=13735 RepID=K7FGE5_PELSI
MLPNGHLHLSRASVQDAGVYLCVAQNPAGTALGKTRLIVQVPPVIEAGQLELSILEGLPVLLPCAARGVPEPRVTWSKDGVPVPGMEGKFTLLPSGGLMVKDSQGGDSGTYTCTAENSAGKARVQLQLSVHIPPTFTELPRDQTLNRGERMRLGCVAKGNPMPHITWLLNNKPVRAGVWERNGQSMLQREAVTQEDSGTYSCVAENGVGSVKAVAFIYVKGAGTGAPVLRGEVRAYQVEPLGGNALLNCDAYSEPAPLIHWNKNGRPLLGSPRLHQLQNGSLAIYGTVHDDAGRYKCMAENELGVVEKEITLALQSAPVFSVTPQDMTVSAGEEVMLHCQATGEPAPTVEWIRETKPLQENHRVQVLANATLLISAVEGTDAGRYECVARNPMGSSVIRAFLTVRGEPIRVRGSLIGIINDQEFGIASLNASVTEDPRSGLATLRSSIGNIPPAVGPLLRVLVPVMAPIYWSFARQSGGARNGLSLTGGVFRQESQVEFATGERLRIAHVARGRRFSSTPWSMGSCRRASLMRTCFSRISASATCRRGPGSCTWSLCRASCRTGSRFRSAGTTASSTPPPGAGSPSRCSAPRPGPSNPPSPQPCRSCSSSSAPPSMQIWTSAPREPTRVATTRSVRAPSAGTAACVPAATGPRAPADPAWT